MTVILGAINVRQGSTLFGMEFYTILCKVCKVVMSEGVILRVAVVAWNVKLRVHVHAI